MTDWNLLADQSLRDAPPTRDEALAVLTSPDDELLALLQAAFRVRRQAAGQDRPSRQ